MLKFEYQDYKTVNINGGRWYIIEEDKIYPSVTTVLGSTVTEEKKKSLERWQQSLGVQKAEAYTKRAGDNGTRLHSMIEQFLKGEEINVPGISHVEWGMFNGLKFKLKKIEQVVGQEVVLFSHELEIAGRCDCIAVYKGELVIIDFKSSVNPKDEKRVEDYKYQIACYMLMHNEMFATEITKGVILIGTENGIPTEFTFNLTNEFIEKLLKRIDAFYAKII